MSEISSVVVSFGLHSGDLDPAHVTSTLGVIPDRTHSRGDPHPGANPNRHSYSGGSWVLHSRLPDAAPLDEHLRDLLDRLDPREVQRLVGEGLVASFRVGCFVEAGQEGATVTAETIRRMEAVGAEFGITIYSGGDDQSES